MFEELEGFLLSSSRTGVVGFWSLIVAKERCSFAQGCSGDSDGNILVFRRESRSAAYVEVVMVEVRCKCLEKLKGEKKEKVGTSRELLSKSIAAIDF